MAYNNYFPVGYQYFQPQYQQSVPTVQPNIQQSNQSNNGLGGIIWVQGEAGAKSYLVAPNTTVQLWDSESQTIYLKSADASGMPSIKTLDYTIREMPNQNHINIQSQPQVDLSQYVTWEALEEKLNALRPKQFNNNKKKENVINE